MFQQEQGRSVSSWQRLPAQWGIPHACAGEQSSLVTPSMGRVTACLSDNLIEEKKTQSFDF